MAQVIGLRKAVQEIALDDSPDSPVYKMELTDTALGKSAKRIKDILGRVEKVQKKIEEAEGQELPEKVKVAVAEIYKTVIAGCLGDEAYKQIVEYVGGEGAKAKDLSTLLTPLVVYLCGELSAVMQAHSAAVQSKYVDAAGA